MTDNEIINAKWYFEQGIKCDIFSEPVLSYAKTVLEAFDLITRQKAEIERLTILAELGNMRANDYRAMRDNLKKANAEIERLKKVNDIRLECLGRSRAKAKAEAIKEFWNQRPPQLNPNQDGKNLYNQGWNDCISFFAEEYEIFLGIKKRAEEMVGDSNG